MLTLAGTGYLGYDAAGVADEAGRGSPGSPLMTTCSAAARTLRPSTPCWTPGRPSRRPSTGPWQPRPAWPVRLVNAVFACSASRPVTRSSSKAARAAWERSPRRWRWPAGARVIASASKANQDYLREIRAIPALYGEGVAARIRAAAGRPADAVFDVAGTPPGADALACEDLPGHGDLLGRGGLVGRGGVPAAAVAEPGLLGELQAAVEAVAGAGAPVTAGLADRDGGPVHPARGRRRRAGGPRAGARSGDGDGGACAWRGCFVSFLVTLLRGRLCPIPAARSGATASWPR